MGKGTITANNGNGNYTVVRNYEDVRYLKEKDYLTNKIDELNVEIIAASVASSAADVKARASLTRLDQAITIYHATLSDGNKEKVKEATQTANEDQKVATAATVALALLQYRRETLDKRLIAINSIYSFDTSGEIIQEELDAWCADYNVDLAVGTEVGLIDIGRERDKILPHQNIFPGGVLGVTSAYDGSRDGILQAYQHASAPAVFYNSAVLPGVNKWKPRYRKGTIVSVDTEADTAVVDIDDLVSTSTTLPDNSHISVNQSSQVVADVVYMGCNGQAFEPDDRVIVAFNALDWAQPKVIGFESNPRECVKLAIFYAYTFDIISPLLFSAAAWDAEINTIDPLTAKTAFSGPTPSGYGAYNVGRLTKAGCFAFIKASPGMTIYKNNVLIASLDTSSIDAFITRSYTPEHQGFYYGDVSDTEMGVVYSEEDGSSTTHTYVIICDTDGVVMGVITTPTHTISRPLRQIRAVGDYFVIMSYAPLPHSYSNLYFYTPAGDLAYHVDLQAYTTYIFDVMMVGTKVYVFAFTNPGIKIYSFTLGSSVPTLELTISTSVYLASPYMTSMTDMHSVYVNDAEDYMVVTMLYASGFKSLRTYNKVGSSWVFSSGGAMGDIRRAQAYVP